MPRLTLDTDEQFDRTLESLTKQGDKADVIRRAVASYQYLKREVPDDSAGRRLAITDAAGNVEQQIVLPDGSQPLPMAPQTPAMAAAPHAAAAPELVKISSMSAGEVTLAPPTFLERWGVIFLGIAGAWVLVVAAVLLLYYLKTQPPLPNTAGMSADQVRDALTAHRQVAEEARSSLTYIFDLLVTRTVLPLCTLLLGYLFGKGKAI